RLVGISSCKQLDFIQLTLPETRLHSFSTFQHQTESSPLRSGGHKYGSCEPRWSHYRRFYNHPNDRQWNGELRYGGATLRCAWVPRECCPAFSTDSCGCTSRDGYRGIVGWYCGHGVSRLSSTQPNNGSLVSRADCSEP